MKINTSNLNFHNTFQPQLIYVAKILNLAANGFCGDEFEISNITGIPTGTSSGKVIPHLWYSKYMGLINFEKKDSKFMLKITKLGRVIFDEDPYLMEDVSKVLLHYNITDVKNGAPQWAFLFREFNSNLNEEYSFKYIEECFQESVGKATAKLSIAKNSYCNKCFDILNVFNVEKESVKFTQVHPRNDLINAYAYTLIKDIEDKAAAITYEENSTIEINEITIDQLVCDLKWNKPLGLDYDSTLEVLDEIALQGYIKLNKQLKPMTIIKLVKSDEILLDLYGFVI